jgi:hypothetical protein
MNETSSSWSTNGIPTDLDEKKVIGENISKDQFMLSVKAKERNIHEI